MRFIDEKGRLFGRISVIDLLILLAVAGLGLGYVYRQTSRDLQQIVSADKTFYVTVVSAQLREFNLDAVAEGDIFHKQYERQPLGSVVKVEAVQSRDVLTKSNGTALLAPVEGRYDLYVTLECTGSMTAVGYYINGNVQVSDGAKITVLSNRLMLDGEVYAVSETKP